MPEPPLPKERGTKPSVWSTRSSKGESQGEQAPHLGEREIGRSEREHEEERVKKADSKEEMEGKQEEPP